MNRSHTFLLVALTAPSNALLCQEAAIEFVPSRLEISACSGEEIEVSLELSNPARVEIGGYQAFLRFPARYFKALRFEPLVLDAYFEIGGPDPLGEGYPPCAAPEADGWGDRAGEDVVAVLASAFGSTASESFRGESAVLGRFVFAPLGEATDSSGALFRTNDEACHPPIDQTTRLFAPDGTLVAAGTPASFSILVGEAGPAARNLSCVDRGATVALSWLPPSSGPFSGYRIYRDSALLASFPIPSIQSFEDRTPPPGTVRYEVAVLLPGGAEGCRASCTVERGSGGGFIRGDSNRDGEVNISDPITILDHLFGGVPLSCLDAGDFDDSGAVNITDPIAILDYLFKAGVKPTPPAPFPDAGADPTADGLDCGA